MTTEAKSKDAAAQGAGETKTPNAPKIGGADAKASAKAKRELEIMTRHKVKTLYRNSKGEYFTSENLANLSESKKENVETITLADATKAAKA